MKKEIKYKNNFKPERVVLKNEIPYYYIMGGYIEYTQDCITVGELKELLSKYTDSDLVTVWEDHFDEREEDVRSLNKGFIVNPIIEMTAEDFEKRDIHLVANQKYYKDRRYESYLKLKEEFDNENR